MRDEPTAPDLLAAAEEAFRETLLPALPKSLRYEALMVLNAMGVAARQAAAGDAPLRSARRRLAAIYGDDAAGLDALEARLADDIRRGRFDPGQDGRAAVLDHLRQTTRDKAAESSPKALSLGLSSP